MSKITFASCNKKGFNIWKLHSKALAKALLYRLTRIFNIVDINPKLHDNNIVNINPKLHDNNIVNINPILHDNNIVNINPITLLYVGRNNPFSRLKLFSLIQMSCYYSFITGQTDIRN